MTISQHTLTSAPNAAALTSVSPLGQSGSSKTKFYKKTNIYQSFIREIIAALGVGVKPCSCPWQRVSGMSCLPFNYATGVAYSGMTIMLLWCCASKQGFGDLRWMTYKQAQAAGAGGKEPVHPANGVCTSVIAVNDGSGMTTDCEVCRTATVTGPVFGVVISVSCRVIRTYLMQESNHGRETTKHAERDHDTRACLTDKSA